MTEDQKDDIKDADRKRKTKVVSKERKTFYLENEREFNRLYKVRVRGNMTDEEIEFHRIELLLRMRKHRLTLAIGVHLRPKLVTIEAKKSYLFSGPLWPMSVRIFLLAHK